MSNKDIRNIYIVYTILVYMEIQKSLPKLSGYQ